MKKKNKLESYGISLAEYLTIHYPEILDEYYKKYNINELHITE